MGVDLDVLAVHDVNEIEAAIGTHSLDPERAFWSVKRYLTELARGRKPREIPAGFLPHASVLEILDRSLAEDPQMVHRVFDCGRLWSKLHWVLNRQLPADYASFALFGKRPIAGQDPSAQGIRSNSVTRCQEIFDVLQSHPTDSIIDAIDYDAFLAAPVYKNFNGPLYESMPGTSPSATTKAHDVATYNELFRQQIDGLKSFYFEVTEQEQTTISYLF